MANTVPLAFTSYAGMDISRDNGLVVDRDYEDRAPYAFTGTVKEVVFDLKPVPEGAERRCTSTRRSKPSGTARRAEQAGGNRLLNRSGRREAGQALPDSLVHLVRASRAVGRSDLGAATAEYTEDAGIGGGRSG